MVSSSGQLDPNDLKVDVYRSNGANGAGNWAVRLTHIPSGLMLSAQGDYAAGESPKSAIERAKADLLVQLGDALDKG